MNELRMGERRMTDCEGGARVRVERVAVTWQCSDDVVNEDIAKRSQVPGSFAEAMHVTAERAHALYQLRTCRWQVLGSSAEAMAAIARGNDKRVVRSSPGRCQPSSQS